MARRLSLVLFCSLGALCATASMAHAAASISITGGPTNGAVYTTAGLPSTLSYTVTGNSTVPSATAECKMTVVGATTQTVEQPCTGASFGHSATPHAPSKQANWSGTGYGVSKNAEGDWTFTVSQTIDGSLYTASRSWAVDNTLPTIDLASVHSPLNDSTPTLTFTVNDAHPGQSVCGFTDTLLETPNYVNCSSPYTPISALLDGTHYFWVYTTDAAIDAPNGFGNTAVSNKAITIDTVAPVVTIELPTTPTTDKTPSIAFTYTDDNGSLPGCRYYATGTAPGAYGICSGDNAFDLPPVADGSWTIDVRYGDPAGNFGTASTVIKVDTAGPEVTIGGLTNGQVLTSTPNLVISAIDLAPDTGVTLLQCAYDSDVLALCSAAAFTTKVLGVGSHTLTVKATDGTGNSSVYTLAFSIKLPDPPAASAPTPIVPTGATFKRTSAKTKKGRYRPVVKVTITLPAGVDASTVCKGSASLTLKAKGGKKAKSAYLHQVELRTAAGGCTGSATFSVPESLAGKKVTTRLTFAGSATLAKFDLTGKIAKI